MLSSDRAKDIDFWLRIFLKILGIVSFDILEFFLRYLSGKIGDNHCPVMLYLIVRAGVHEHVYVCLCVCLCMFV